ncbi:MAG TPA: hypothetical protein DEF11_02375, partial [Shigella sp.]|nr:hypothetical protein [Shigella sp.]
LSFLLLPVPSFCFFFLSFFLSLFSSFVLFFLSTLFFLFFSLLSFRLLPFLFPFFVSLLFLVIFLLLLRYSGFRRADSDTDAAIRFHIRTYTRHLLYG